MSLSRLGMRIAAARAIRDETMADGRVFDSRIDPLSLTHEDGGQPAIIVTTDDHVSDPHGRDMLGGEHTCDLIVEIVIASQVTVPGMDGETLVSIDIPHTDEGLEMILDLIEAQTIRALTAERDEWGAIWMLFVPRITQRVSRRGASVENGARFAARQLVLSCDLLSDPVPAAAPANDSAWGRLLAALEADGALAGVAKILRAQIEDDRADWRVAADALGIHEATSDALGLGPDLNVADPGDDPVPIAAITTDDGFVADEDAADDQGV
ncbi:MAG: hypothetical protein LC676_10695 [Loktanella sp.]|nr:hypothetical protein [Loktanella sp.]